jgi:hypothetical protein
MKKLAITLLSFTSFAFLLASCHYGQSEAKQTIERNEQYKTEKADYSINRADGETTTPPETVAADTTSK